MKNELITEVVDLGNYNIKIEDIAFVSTFTELYEADQSENKILEYEGTRYRMEYEGAFDSEFNKVKKHYIPNLLWALDKSGAKDGNQYRLMLGLPLNNLGQTDKIKSDLEGKSFTFKTDATKTITIKEVVVVGECISSYYVLPANIREEDIVLIDLGGRTANVVEYSNKRIKKSDTINIGMIDFYNRVKSKFNNEHGENVETHNIKHLIDKGVIPQYECVEDTFVKDLINMIKEFNLGLGKKIIFTGGGSLTLKDAITRYNNKFMFIDDPIHSNVNGNIKLAKAKGWL